MIALLLTLTTAILIFAYPIWYITVSRNRELESWSMPPDQMDQALVEIGESPHITEIRFGEHEALHATGQHEFISFCRIVAARAIFEEKKIKSLNHSESSSRHDSRDHASPSIAPSGDQHHDRLFSMLFQAAGMGHRAYPTMRTLPLHMDGTIFDHLFSHGPYIFPWSIRNLLDTLNQARELFARDNICLVLESPVIMIADIRGRYVDLHRWIQICGVPYRKKLLFLGGLIEPESSVFQTYSIECLSFVAAMKITYPQHVFLLRGAAETAFSFPARFGLKADLAVLTAARQMCSFLPLAALIDNEILAVPSGFNHQLIYDPNCFVNLTRPLKCDNLPLFVRFLIFGQPSSTTQIFSHEKREGLYKFGLQAVKDLCSALKLKQVVRGRNVLPKSNPLFLCNRKMVSFYSHPVENVPGTVLYRDKTRGTVILRLKFQEKDFYSPAPYKRREAATERVRSREIIFN